SWPTVSGTTRVTVSRRTSVAPGPPRPPGSRRAGRSCCAGTARSRPPSPSPRSTSEPEPGHVTGASRSHHRHDFPVANPARAARNRWAYAPAAALGASGVARLAFAPGEPAMTHLAWVWAPVLVFLGAWIARRTRQNLRGSRTLLVYPVAFVMVAAGVGGL